LEDAQAVSDRQAGCADEKTACEMFARLAPHRVDRLPCDDHGHDGGLACARRQFQCEPHQFRVGVFVRGSKVVKQALTVPEYRRDFGQPYRGFHRFHLAEERADAIEFVMAPVPKEKQTVAPSRRRFTASGRAAFDRFRSPRSGRRRSAATTLAGLLGRPSSVLRLRPAPVALTPIALLWRPQYPNERPYRSAAVVSAVGQSTKSLRDSPLRGAHEPRERCAWQRVARPSAVG
jgi:hypothetical protein